MGVNFSLNKSSINLWSKHSLILVSFFQVPKKPSCLPRSKPYSNQHALTTFDDHIRCSQLLSPILMSIMLLFPFPSVSPMVLTGGSELQPIPRDGSTIRFTISNTSLIFGRDFEFLVKHRLATTASLWADLIKSFHSSLGSNICRNFLESARCGFTQSKSFCSFLGRLRSNGRLPVINS